MLGVDSINLRIFFGCKDFSEIKGNLVTQNILATFIEYT